MIADGQRGEFVVAREGSIAMGVVGDVASKIERAEGTFAEESAVNSGGIVMRITDGYRLRSIGDGQRREGDASVEGIVTYGGYGCGN